MRRFNGICVITSDVRRLSDFYRSVLEVEPEGDETFVKRPTTQPWGRRSIWFRDPDGNVVNFNAPVPAV
jgi:catechol 2,3-dioxygenase-like lactoylglutathione lyase family enzyme